MPSHLDLLPPCPEVQTDGAGSGLAFSRQDERVAASVRTAQALLQELPRHHPAHDWRETGRTHWPDAALGAWPAPPLLAPHDMAPPLWWMHSTAPATTRIDHPTDRRTNADTHWPPPSQPFTGARWHDWLRGRWLGGWALLMAGSPDPQIGRGPAGEPRFPTGFVGSLSHSGPWTVAWAGPDRGTHWGVDVQVPLSDAEAAAVRQVCAHPTEVAWIDAHPTARQREATALLFSAKESIYKALYPLVQCWFGPECARLHSLRPSPAPGATWALSLVFEVTPPGSDRLPWRVRVWAHPHCDGTWCTVAQASAPA